MQREPDPDDALRPTLLERSILSSIRYESELHNHAIVHSDASVLPDNEIRLIVPLFRLIQGRRRSWHCGAHTLVNSQETCFVSGLAAAIQLGADYPFDNEEARRSFNHYGSLMYGWRLRKAKG